MAVSWTENCPYCYRKVTVGPNDGSYFRCPHCGKHACLVVNPDGTNPWELRRVASESDGADSATKLSNPKSAVGAKKVPLSLCSPIAEAHWALAQFAGLTKYGAWNWRAAGVDSQTYTDAIRRHCAAYVSGEELDPTDGTHHLGNIMACCAILLEARAIGKLNDTRPPSFSIRETYKFVEDGMERLRVQYKDMDPRHWTIGDTDEIANRETGG